MELVIDTSGMRKRTALSAGRNNSPNELTSDPYNSGSELERLCKLLQSKLTSSFELIALKNKELALALDENEGLKRQINTSNHFYENTIEEMAQGLVAVVGKIKTFSASLTCGQTTIDDESCLNQIAAFGGSKFLLFIQAVITKAKGLLRKRDSDMHHQNANIARIFSIILKEIMILELGSLFLTGQHRCF